MFSVETGDVATVGKNLQDEAANYKNIVTQIYSDVEDLRNTWQGTDSDTYVAQVNEKKETIESLGVAIEEYGQFLINTSTTYNNLRDNVIANAKKV